MAEAGSILQEFFTGLQKSLTDSLSMAKTEVGAGDGPTEDNPSGKFKPASSTRMDGGYGFVREYENAIMTFKSVVPAIESIAKALSPGDENGEGAGVIVKTINDLRTDNETLRDALVKALDRIGDLEKGTSIRKSLAGDDFTDDEQSEPLRKSANGASKDTFGGVIRTLVRAPMGTTVDLH